MEEIFHRHLLTRRQEHGRTGRRAVPLLPGFGADGEFRVELQIALLDQAEGNVRRHHLRHGSRRDARFAALVIEHGAR